MFAPTYRTRPMRKIVWLLIVFVLILAACREEEVVTPEAVAATAVPPTATYTAVPTDPPTPIPTITPSPTPLPTDIPTPTSEPTEPPPTPTATPTATKLPTPTPTPEPDVVYEGVQFSYQDLLVYEDVSPELVTAVPKSPGILFESGNPDYFRFAFGDAIVNAPIFQPRQPQLHIYPVEDYEAMFDEVVNRIDALQRLLDERPTSGITTTLPFLPLVNTTETFHAQMAYLDFQNGVGVRFITQYDQNPGPVSNESIFYTFQGLTTDRQYYVAAFFPISATAVLSDTFADVDLAVFRTAESTAGYFAQTTQMLENLDADNFTPDLSQIDAVMQSLLVEPASLAVPEAEVVSGPTAVITGAIRYPGVLPVVRIYAQDVSSGAFFFTDTGITTYTLTVPPGTYYLFAYTLTTIEGGGYTQAVLCEAGDECVDHGLTAVTVAAGDTATEIDLADWSIPVEDLPAPPDGLGAETDETGDDTGDEPAAEPTPTPTPEPTPVAGFGQITGALSGPDPDAGVPAMQIHVYDVATGLFYSINLAAGYGSYFIEVPAGEFQVFAYLLDGETAGGYTQAVVCGLTAECTDHTLVTFTVGVDENVTGIDITDWQLPPDSLPPLP